MENGSGIYRQGKHMHSKALAGHLSAQPDKLSCLYNCRSGIGQCGSKSTHKRNPDRL